jgi:hypothetical protein
MGLPETCRTATAGSLGCRLSILVWDRNVSNEISNKNQQRVAQC